MSTADFPPIPDVPFDVDGCHARMVPELMVLDMARSRVFWRELLGFDVVFSREAHDYLRHGEVEMMLCQATRHWSTGPFDPPLGRGINFKIFVDDPQPLRDRLVDAGWPIFEDITEEWPVQEGISRGYRQFLVQDPDGYLIRFAAKLGAHPANQDTDPPPDGVYRADK
jgi:catechol 2,3-dioxygenase-like lactoylglutathione lyase family enzyme